MCEGLARTVRFLRELRLALLDLMLVDLTQITNIYLGSLRDKDSATVGSVSACCSSIEYRLMNIENYGLLDPSHEEC